jgi:hypothetical protein
MAMIVVKEPEAMRYRKFILSVSWIFLLTGLAQALVIMDLEIVYDPSDDSARVSWYPEVKSDTAGYVISAYDSMDSILMHKTVSPSATSLVLSSVLAKGITGVDVVAYDADGGVTERTLMEEVHFTSPGTAGAQTDASADAGSWIDADFSLESLDSGAFPMLYATVTAEGIGYPAADPANIGFKVFEDGMLQTAFLDITSSVERTEVPVADIVILIDSSGSMRDELAAVRNNIIAFADVLAAGGIDYRIGLVQFGNPAGPTLLKTSGALTNDAEAFKSEINLSASGGAEPVYEALNLAIRTFTFRPEAQRHFLLISDEDAKGYPMDMINLICSNQVTAHVAVSDSGYYGYKGPGSVSERSGGLVFPVAGPYDEMVGAMAGLGNAVYTIRYKTSNTNYDGTARQVDVVLTGPPASVRPAAMTASYTPGGAPVITRTSDTRALHDGAQVAGAALRIEAEVKDDMAPFVRAATLFVRTAGSEDAWTALQMRPVGNSDIYAATLPPDLVVPPGIDYYVRAADGEVTSSSPSHKPRLDPYQLAVVSNLAPVITHTPPPIASAPANLDLVIRAEDTTAGLSDLTVHYRSTGELFFEKIGRTYDPAVTQSMESITIPLTNSTLSSIDYYITATDNCGVKGYWSGRTAEDPYAIDVVAGQAPLEVLEDDAADGSEGIDYARTLTKDSSSVKAVDPGVIGPAAAGVDPPDTGEVSLFVTDEAEWIESSAAAIGSGDLTPPSIHTITPASLIAAAGQTVTFSADVSDLCDTEVDVVWDYDDGAAATPVTTNAFAEAGVYNVNVIAMDDAGNAATGSVVVVIYDPAGGAVFGGGRINPTADAYKQRMVPADHADFGFVIRYSKDRRIPVGNSTLQFHTADLAFHSDSVKWVVVNQDHISAHVKGVGTINGEGEYGFMLWVGDSAVDTFRIRIWEEHVLGGRTVLFDNGVLQPVQRGSITIQEDGGR